MVGRHRLPRRRAWAAPGSALALVFALGLTAHGTAASAAPAASNIPAPGRASAAGVTPQQSENWSGYVAQNDAGKTFSSVSGSWVQPAVNSSSADPGYSAFWVGLGGSSQQSSSLEQVGTSAEISNGQTTYYAWYELVPAAQQRLSLAIHPGDHMRGRVTVNGNTVTVSLTDETTGNSALKTLQMSDPDTSSAEWIAEAPAAVFPNGDTQILPLADFGRVTFNDASATAGGETGTISDPAWTVQRVDMSGASSLRFVGPGRAFSQAGPGAAQSQQAGGGASTSGVSSGGGSFTVTYSSGSGNASSGSGAGYTGYGGGNGNAGYGDPGYGGYGDPAYGYGGSGDPGYGYGYSGGYGAYSPSPRRRRAHSPPRSPARRGPPRRVPTRRPYPSNNAPRGVS